MLRSGKYKQCYGTLTYEGKYCVLGVLTLAMGKDPQNNTMGYSNLHDELESETVNTLWRLNDGYHDDYSQPLSFRRLATWIEKTPME